MTYGGVQADPVRMRCGDQHLAEREQRIQDYFRANKVKDIEVKHAMIGDIGPYKGRENMVVVWMTKIDPSFNAPSVQGLPFMIGSRKQKDELCKQIFDLMNEIYQP